MNWTLFAVITILAVFAIVGLKKGIVRMILSLVFSVVGFIVAIIITPAITSYVRINTNWDEKIEKRTFEYMEEAGFLITSDSEEVKEIFPNVFQKEINYGVSEQLQNGVDVCNDYMTGMVANFILSTIVYILVFIVIVVVCGIIGAVVNTIAKLPVIRTANDIGGMIAGFFLGTLFVSLMFLVLMAFSNFSWAERIYEDIENNPVLSFMYNRNLILMIIAKIF